MPQPQSAAEPKPSDALTAPPLDSDAIAWQEKLLPLMKGMLVALTAFFIIATLYQAYNIQQRIIDLGRDEFKVPVDATGSDADTWRARVGLEAYAMRHRYQHSSLILMARAWIIYLGFVTGMILATVGATFVLGKIREQESQLSAKGGAGEFSFKSTSPGLVLAVLGTALMICTMVIRADVTVTDTPLYLLPDVRVTGARPPVTEPGKLSEEGKRSAATADDSALDEINANVKKRDVSPSKQ